MLGLFGTLNLGARSLQTQQLGVEVAGHNLANVNNPDYSRQRVDIDTSFTIPTPIGPQGTGASVVAIQQMRSALLDGQLQTEISVSGYLDAQQQALQSVQANLGEQLNSQANSAESTAASQGVGGGAALAASIGDLFNSFQSLATDPASLAERQVLLLKAQTLATQFNQVSKRLGDLSNSLNTSLASDVSDANQLLTSIAQLNNQIANSENATGGKANDLRDEREAKIEALSKLVNISLTNGTGGAIDVAVAGTTLVSGNQVLDTMQVYDAGAGQMHRVEHLVAGNQRRSRHGDIDFLARQFGHAGRQPRHRSQRRPHRWLQPDGQHGRKLFQRHERRHHPAQSNLAQQSGARPGQRNRRSGGRQPNHAGPGATGQQKHRRP